MLVTPMDSEKAILRDLTMCGIYMHFQLFNFFSSKDCVLYAKNTCPKATMLCNYCPGQHEPHPHGPQRLLLVYVAVTYF